mgnify:CR=1 FL=1
MIDHRGERIIPALAGNTITADQIACLLADHPRSRGEYRAKDVLMVIDDGSSPLSRGIRLGCRFLGRSSRIIPALAGNTRDPARATPQGGDHPRSRGEYLFHYPTPPAHWGSSPLSRGILSVTGILVEPGRIIPALAGNTASSRAVAAGSGDHPRSRGEYLGVWWICWGRCGSSPLSRGIRVWGEGL